MGCIGPIIFEQWLSTKLVTEARVPDILVCLFPRPYSHASAERIPVRTVDMNFARGRHDVFPDHLSLFSSVLLHRGSGVS